MAEMNRYGLMRYAESMRREKAARLLRIIQNHPKAPTRKWDDQSMKYTSDANTVIAKEEGVHIVTICRDVAWLRQHVKHCGTCGAMLIPPYLIQMAIDGKPMDTTIERIKPTYPVLEPKPFAKLTRESATRRFRIWKYYGNPFELEGLEIAKAIAAKLDCSYLAVINDIEWLQHHIIICEECGLIVGIKGITEAMLAFEDKSRS